MVSEWMCPHCNLKFYSANEQRDEEYVSCASCGEEVANPYFEGCLAPKNDKSNGTQYQDKQYMQ